ncbi:MAG TPA: ANTAR domain-containing protein [Streptosporangiaceae bacterium]|nr:ANTAR domain-containing protein [Streptosporangiaceae bacterium]
MSGWHDGTAGRHAAPAPAHAQSTAAGPAYGDGSPAEHAPVARRTATGWRVGDEEVSDLTSAMVLADLLAADLPKQAMPTVGAQAQAAASADGSEVTDPRKLEQTVAQLEHALTARVRVEQAIGVLAERHRLRPRQAFELLRSVARAQGRRVLEMATEVVDSATNPLLRIPEELAKPPVVRRRSRRLGPDVG